LYYLSIGAVNKAAGDLYYRTVAEGMTAPVGFCSVEYTDDYDAYSAQIDQSVRKYTVLQNTGFILKELSQLVNRRQYYTAILLVDSQIKMLEKYQAEKQDEEIAKDIETLSKNRELLMEQAKNLNHIR
jgi:hypothetical protein